jgi:hypothetical protein
MKSCTCQYYVTTFDTYILMFNMYSSVLSTRCTYTQCLLQNPHPEAIIPRWGPFKTAGTPADVHRTSGISIHGQGSPGQHLLLKAQNLCPRMQEANRSDKPPASAGKGFEISGYGFPLAHERFGVLSSWNFHGFQADFLSPCFSFRKHRNSCGTCWCWCYGSDCDDLW